MYKIIQDTNEGFSFALSFIKDKTFADPNHASEKEFRESLERYTSNPQKYRTIGIYEDNALIGLFSFLIIPKEKYIEMLLAVSRQQEAYLQMMDYLREIFLGYECFFVYNPRNEIFHELMKKKKAQFDTEQIKMDLKNEKEMNSHHSVIAYSEIYREDYAAIHLDENHYWTTEKVLSCPEKFHVFLALENMKVVGYLDMEHSCDVNEPFELYVHPAYRCKGYGRALLEKAIISNRPKGMMLHVDIDNVAAIHLYSSLGFEKDEFGSSIVARLTLSSDI